MSAATALYPNAWYAALDYMRYRGLDTVFGLPADDLAALTAVDSAGVRMVLCRDQRNAVFMATGYALQSGKPGVCLIGKGPAVTNALTGVLEARYSAVPLVVLAAGTGRDRRGSGAFQELDQISLVAPLVKWSQRVDHPDRVIAAVEKAFLMATNGVPGPVYLEFPDDLAGEEIVRDRLWLTYGSTVRAATSELVDGDALHAIRDSRRPTILVGGGMRHRNADRIVERFAERIGAPMITTASGRGSLDENHSQFCGLSGLYASSATRDLLQKSDLVIALGSRLEETATFGWPGLGTAAPVLQVNIDPVDLSTEYWGPKIVGDAASIIRGWLDLLPTDRPVGREWLDHITRCRDTLRRDRQKTLDHMSKSDQIHVAEVLAAIDSVVPSSRILVQENGLQDMWSYFYPFYLCSAQGGSIVPSEQTSLGFGVSAAAGVRLAAPNRPVVVFAGDGAFEMGRIDLETMAREGIGVLYVVLHNGGYGWLHAQLGRLGLDPDRFPFVSTVEPGACAPARGDLEQTLVTHKSDLEPQLKACLDVALDGRVAVAHVPVQLDDVHPCISALSDGSSGAGPAAQGTGENQYDGE